MKRLLPLLLVAPLLLGARLQHEGASGGGTGTGDIESVTAGNGLTGGGTTGAVTLDVGEGLGIDAAADAVALDPTEVGSVTWGTADATWTFDATGAVTSPSLSWSDSLITFNHGVTVTGTLTGTLTGNAGTATALAADPGNCAGGGLAGGVTAAGVAEACITPDAGTNIAADLEEETHATEHSLGGTDAITATNLASGCTDAQVLGGTAGGTGVECQTDANSGGAPAWSAITAPTGAVSLVSDGTTETFTVDFQSAFTTGNQLDVKQTTGNPSGGTLAGFTVADANVSPIMKIENTGAVTVATGLLLGATDAGGVLTLAIDASDAEIGTALRVDANDIVGTTGLINYTNFDVDAAGKVTALGGASVGTTNTVEVSSAGAVTFAGTAQPFVVRWLRPAQAIVGAVSAPLYSTVVGTNINYDVLGYDGAASEAAFWSFRVPTNITGTTAQVQIFWTTTSCTPAGDDGVQFEVASQGVTDDEVLDAALGAAVAIDDTCTAANDIMKTAAGTLTHGWAGDDYATVKVSRDIADAGDDLTTADARILGVSVKMDVAGLDYQ